MRSTFESKDIQVQAEEKMADDVVVVADGALSTIGKSMNPKSKYQASATTEAKEMPADFRYMPYGSGSC